MGGEDPLEKEVAPTPVLLPEKSHGQRGLAGLQSMGSPRVRHDWATKQQQKSNILLKNVILFLDFAHTPPPLVRFNFPFCTELETQGGGRWAVKIRSCQAEAWFWEANGIHFLWYKHRITRWWWKTSECRMTMKFEEPWGTSGTVDNFEIKQNSPKGVEI